MNHRLPRPVSHSGYASRCHGSCLAIWPAIRGIPVLARGVRVRGTFGRINGQVTFDGLPRYGFAGEGSHQNFANGQFPVVRVVP
jgi:hypothetical protein